MVEIIAGNWKMNMSFSEIDEYFKYFSENREIKKNREVWIAPPFVYLQYVKDKSLDLSLPFKIGAQNCYYEDKGAFTGEISINMLRDLNIDFVIVGHSERRHIFKETEELLYKKLYKVLRSNLICIYCIGEKLEEREDGKTIEILTQQLENILMLEDVNLENLVIAYEPVWAIGTGKNATSEQIREVHTFIKNYLKKNIEIEVPILYGGSVKPENIKEILNTENVNGVLVGGASLIAEKFYKIINS